MKAKIDLKELTKKIFIIFLIFQPILDIYMCLFDNKIQILGVSLATIVRFGIVFLMMVLIMIYARKNKSTKFLFGYIVLVGIYAIFHHLNAVSFTVSLANAEYSAFSELLYLARMSIPVIMIYIIYHIKPTYKDIKKIVITVSLIISLTILITNILKISYKSYSLENSVIVDNMFSWFTKENNYYWVDLTARGWFSSGNQVSGVMIILAPLVTYIALNEKKFKNWIIVLLHIISMLFLTTRIGVLGGIASAIAVCAIYFMQKLIHKEIQLSDLHYRSFMSLVIVLLVFGVFYKFSPFQKRLQEGQFGYDMMSKSSINVVNQVDEKVEIGYDLELSETEKLEFLKETIPTSSVPEYYSYYVYPYYQDISFWYDFINMPEYERTGNRRIRELFIARILERDNRISNYLVGISFTRASSFIWPENDIKTHLDCLGIFGEMLFIVPYFVVLIFGIIKFFMKFKENLYLSKVIYMFSLFIGILAGYVSGHVMNEMFPFFFLSFVAGIVLNMCFGNVLEEYEKKRNLRQYFDKLYVGGKEKFHSEIKEALVNEEKRFIVTANPETLMIAEKNEEFKKCLLQDYVTIVPDGIGIIKGAKMLEYPQRETITGVGLVESLFEACNENKKSVFLFGAKPEVVSKLNEVIEQKYPNINVVGFENGYVEDKQEVFERIQECNPDLILVALGIPNQELLIDKNFEKFNKGIFIGVGGSFDVLSGMKKRAPKIFIKLHLEWLYRITTEPKRIKRFIDSNVKYLFKLSEEK